MLGEYEDVKVKVASALREFGFLIARDEDFYAEFAGNLPFRIAIEGDRVAYPGFSILLFLADTNENEKSVSIALLMQMNDHEAGRTPRKPSLDNQLDFIRKNWGLFEDWRLEDAYREFVRTK